MIASGESANDALAKTGAHVIGAMIGSAIPGLGTIAGAATGAVIGWGINTGIDFVYDNQDKIIAGVSSTSNKIGKTVINLTDKIGDGIFSFRN